MILSPPSEFDCTIVLQVEFDRLFPGSISFRVFYVNVKPQSEAEEPEITRCFTHFVSLQERPKIPYSVEKRGFSGSPESTLNWSVFGPSQVRSSPATPFGWTEEDAWD